MRDSSFLSQFCSSALRSKPLGKSSDVVRGEGLVRRLGPFDLILLGIGASIGAGIFVVTGTVARDAGPGIFSFSFFSFNCFTFELIVICMTGKRDPNLKKFSFTG